MYFGRLAQIGAVAISLGSVAQGATYFVATTGSDAAGDGSAAKPWATLQKAADNVSAGDTVVVRAGTYSDAATHNVTISSSGLPGRPIVFRSEQKWAAKIDGANKAEVGFYVNADHVTVRDFEITGQSSLGARGNPSNRDLVFIGNKFHHIGRLCTDTPYGIAGFFTNNSSDVWLSDNVFHDIGRYGPGEEGCAPATSGYQNLDHAIYLSAVSNVTIKNNTFFNISHGWGVHIYDASGGMTNKLQILENTFNGHNPWRRGQVIIASPTRDSVIDGNKFIRAAGYSIEYYRPGEQANNFARNNVSYPQGIGTPRAGWTYLDNTVDPEIDGTMLKNSIKGD